MLSELNRTELTLLEYLHHHSTGRGERISMDPKAVRRGLGVNAVQFARDSASLAAHGLAGVRDFRPNANEVPSAECSAIWLTGKGEQYVKQSRRGATAARAGTR